MPDNLSESEELELLQLQKAKAMAMQSTQPQSFMDSLKSTAQQAPQIASQALEAANPVQQTKNFFQTDPATMQRVGGSALPIAGGAIAGPIGASGGELLRQMTGTALATETVPKTPLGRFASVMGAGVAQEPKILETIPGVPAIKDMASKMLSTTGRGLAKAGQTLSGVKENILKQAAEQGLSTYTAPSIPKAQSIFASALGKEGQAAMKQSAKEAFDPALGKARDIATAIGTKIENGEPISAIEALQARQATDRVISATPVTDKVSRKVLYEWRNQFDNELTGQSGKLADASKTYRKAIVKDTILNPTRLNKSGEPSAFLPMLIGHGMMGKGVEGGLGMLTGTSPAMWGLGATAGGSAARGLNKLGQDPAIRQTLLGVLQQIMQKQQAQPAQGQ